MGFIKAGIVATALVLFGGCATAYISNDDKAVDRYLHKNLVTAYKIRVLDQPLSTCTLHIVDFDPKTLRDVEDLDGLSDCFDRRFATPDRIERPVASFGGVYRSVYSGKTLSISTVRVGTVLYVLVFSDVLGTDNFDGTQRLVGLKRVVE